MKFNCHRATAALMLAFLSFGCTGRPLQGVLVPNAQAIEGTSQVSILSRIDDNGCFTVRDAYLGMKKTAQLAGGFHSSFPDAMRR
jgi:hypothetical protein